MSRALRVQYAGAWYHVSNRGAARQRIFRNDQHRQLLLDLLAELIERFGVEIHVYCLMGNRYDLILRTPVPNLSLAMRHLDGVYTQRYNRSLGRDGPLFRGRYRAVLFDADSCLLPLSRYLHRRPLVTGTVPRLDRYRWSSYPSYVTRRRNPPWLCQNEIEARLDPGDETASRAYRQYVEQEAEPAPWVRGFYRSSRPGHILGPPEFRRWVLAECAASDSEVPRYQARPQALAVEVILQAVADHYQLPVSALLVSCRGRLNLPRLAAVWLCHRHAELTLAQLAERFGLASYGSASSILHRVRTQMQPAFWRHIQAIEARLDG